MPTIPFPPDLCSAKLSFSLERNVGIAESPISRAVQRQIRGGDRWRVAVELPPALHTDRQFAQALSFLDQMSRGDTTCWMSPPQSQQTGAWNPQNLVSNGDWLLGTPGSAVIPNWQSQADLTVFTDGQGRLQLDRSGTGGGITFSQNFFPVTANKQYAAVTDLSLFDTLATVSYVNSDASTCIQHAPATVPTRRLSMGAPTGSVVSAYVQMTGSQFSKGTVGSLVFAECGIADAASPAGQNVFHILGYTGNATVGGYLPGALKAGTFFAVPTTAGVELKRLVRDYNPQQAIAYNSVNYLHGNLFFEPALRGSITAYSPVLIYRPFAKFRLAKAESAGTYGPPILGTFAFELIEDFS